jgi:hypothetical protein
MWLAIREHARPGDRSDDARVAGAVWLAEQFGIGRALLASSFVTGDQPIRPSESMHEPSSAGARSTSCDQRRAGQSRVARRRHLRRRSCRAFAPLELSRGASREGSLQEHDLELLDARGRTDARGFRRDRGERRLGVRARAGGGVACTSMPSPARAGADAW